jgi:hypothetical protein
MKDGGAEWKEAPEGQANGDTSRKPSWSDQGRKLRNPVPCSHLARPPQNAFRVTLQPMYDQK